MRIQRVDQEFHVILSAEDMKILNLSEGATVEVTPVQTSPQRVEDMTDEQAIAAYQATLPQFRAAYEELAK